MKILSSEITYRQIIEQVFFEDETELIVTIGWPEGQEEDVDITLNWVTGEPEWAKEYVHNVD
jgi:hypothetical protein